MLARRFTIVCLVTTIFGMALAILVAQPGRSDEGRRDCLIPDVLTCIRSR
ncbi:MAG: hypothetical protein AB7S80_05980 [Rhizobiaceae bacterium]